MISTSSESGGWVVLSKVFATVACCIGSGILAYEVRLSSWQCRQNVLDCEMFIFMAVDPAMVGQLL